MAPHDIILKLNACVLCTWCVILINIFHGQTPSLTVGWLWWQCWLFLLSSLDPESCPLNRTEVYFQVTFDTMLPTCTSQSAICLPLKYILKTKSLTITFILISCLLTLFYKFVLALSTYVMYKGSTINFHMIRHGKQLIVIYVFKNEIWFIAFTSSILTSTLM